MEIKVDDLINPKVQSLLHDHLDDMRSTSPPESTHTLDLSELQKPDITFWAAWEESDLVGCGALKAIDADTAEIKSMRTSKSSRGKGIGSAVLKHIIEFAKGQGYRSIYLETGSMSFFKPARKLYQKYGFENCKPFAAYAEDPNSVFMLKRLC